MARVSQRLGERQVNVAKAGRLSEFDVAFLSGSGWWPTLAGRPDALGRFDRDLHQLDRELANLADGVANVMLAAPHDWVSSPLVRPGTELRTEVVAGIPKWRDRFANNGVGY